MSGRCDVSKSTEEAGRDAEEARVSSLLFAGLVWGSLSKAMSLAHNYYHLDAGKGLGDGGRQCPWFSHLECEKSFFLFFFSFVLDSVSLCSPVVLEFNI